MRILWGIFGLLFLGGVAAAQAPASKPTSKPTGSLAQVMRGIYFPNANILFDVQSKDPATFGKKEAGGGATADFSGIYTGWQVVENSAIALEEATSLLGVATRLCENGRPVPVQRADWAQYTLQMKTAAKKMYDAAKSRNRELASETTNDIAGACESCHTVYRDKAAGVPRCIP
jgi:hypothetical protein